MTLMISAAAKSIITCQTFIGCVGFGWSLYQVYILIE